MSKEPQLILTSDNTASSTLFLSGNFEVPYWFAIKQQIENLEIYVENLKIDFKKIQHLDTFGAWQLAQLWKNLEKKHHKISIVNCHPGDLDFIVELKKTQIPAKILQNIEQKRLNPIEALGDHTLKAAGTFFRVTSFLGEVVMAIGHCIRRPSLFRFKSFIKYVDNTGVKAIPIITLVSFLIGVVLVYQGVDQLERFGAEIFTVNLLAVSVLRELGILMTAIVIAGRSGSAFTAQIGFMKLNQELDAMKVLGLEPMQLLVVPRILALMLVLPLLTLFCDLAALSGGALMSMHLIDLSFSQFMLQLQTSFGPSTFWIGIIKAPVFAFVIALIGCYEGLQVSGGSEDVGRRTTQSVVRSIFMVIVLNAFFSIFFSILKI